MPTREIEGVVGVGKFLFFLFLNLIQPIGLIYTIIKIINPNEPESFRNFCKAYLIVEIGVIVVMILLAISLSAFVVVME